MCKNCSNPALKLAAGSGGLCSRCYKVKLYGPGYAKIRPVLQRGTCTICKQERLLVNKRRECRRCRYDAAGHRAVGDWSKKQKRQAKVRAKRRLWLKALGKCAICGVERHLQLDHKHDLSCGHGKGARPCTKCKRDYICHLCNKGLGMFQDSPGLLDEARKYLLTWETKLRIA